MKLKTYKDAEFLASEWLGDSQWDERDTDESIFASYLRGNFSGLYSEEFSAQIGDADAMFTLIETLKKAAR